MAAKFLGQFLLEQGLIDRQQLLDALEAQRASNPLLGELAVAAGMLAPAQAQRINERQRSEDKRFGDLALEMGLLDAAQVDELLAQQKQGRKLFGEILVEQGALAAEQLAEALQIHQREREVALQSVELGLAGHPSGDVMEAALATCGRLFPRLLKTPAQISSALEAADAIHPGQVNALVRIGGERPLRIAIACDPDTAGNIATSFLGISPDDCDADLALDALGELVNVVMGYVAKDALPDDASYRPEPPAFNVPAKEFLEAKPAHLAVAMTSQLGGFVVVVSG